MSLIRMKHKMRRAIRPFLLAFAGIFFISCFTLYGNYRTASVAAAAPLARVNDAEISQSDYEQARARLEGYFGKQGGLDAHWMLTKYAFESIVDEYLRKHAAEARGLSVSRREAEDARDAEVESQLKQIGEGLTGTQLEEERSRLRALPENSIEARQRQMLGQKLDEDLKSKAQPVEVQVAQVVVKTDKLKSEQALEKAKSLAEKAKSGADFAALARSSSDDERTKAKGGDLGWIKPDSPESPEVVAAALQLKKGQVTDPIAVDHGFVVLKALDAHPYVSTKKDPKEQKDDVEQYKNRVGTAISRGFYSTLKRQAKIEPLSPLARGLVAEENVGVGGSIPETSPESKQKTEAAIKAYEEMKKSETSPTPDFNYHLGQLYVRAGQNDRAEKTFQEVLGRVSAAEVHMALAGVYEKQLEQANEAKRTDEAEKKKAAAVAEYQEASKNAYDQPSLHGELEEKFKKLGRPDLAKQEGEKNKKYLQDMADQQKRQQEQQKAMMELQKKAAQQKPGAKPGATGTAVPTGGSTTTATAVTPSGARVPIKVQTTITPGKPGPKPGSPTAGGTTAPPAAPKPSSGAPKPNP